ncbi:hypothetical protein P691DRAFT_705890 [Macrolepiota fuliginosa MF-IS2]|uniref:EF-hand domain-containing protein n=1 Tax=Macrolepiota fuliginosa MF-IS2 TaxID=1400762 RepID=A0A9P6C3X5_9AGAR|nr:hypothetical protein P691DRAFT_705890 [Macrolepiota fuliginosa MF-IS2]
MSLDNKTIDNAISGFAESVKVVMNGLDALGQVHPFVGVAVVAFKLVVTLDLTRRENNQKVMAVKIQMQQMMCTLFQLRRIKDQDEVGPDGMILKDRLQPLMERIARDIKECGSACDVYLKKSFIAKTLKSKIYEGRLADYAAKFMDYRDQLDKDLTVHIALGVDAANEKLDTQSIKLQTIEEKLDLLSNVFRKLDTPREREVLEFIEQNGGPKTVIERNDLVQNLVKKSGETVASLADKSLTSKSDVDSVKEKLKKELAEDVDVLFKRNYTLFDRKLEIQSRNIADALEKQGQYIVSVLSSGAHEKIKDIDLQNLWREMGWKGSVKARHFVLALRDYFTDQFTTGTPLPKAGGNFTIQAPSPTLTSMDHWTIMAPPSLPGLVDDQWALEYINVAHLQSILEAIDDDGTGFISIKEANTFAIERPKGWSLLHWIAFWAKGWEMNLADYENKMFLILQEMDKLHQNVLKENRYYVDTYLRHYAITGIELVLRSVKTSKEYPQVCHELVSLTEAYAGGEEERLRKNLENIGYDMDSAATVTLITGPGRIERYLFPLLYLTLKRHLEVFHYACRHVVDSEEFSHMSTTLGSVFDVVEQRIESLGAIYKQVHVDLNAHLENFALGMFHDFAVSEYSYGERESLIMGWEDTSKTKNESDETKITEDPDNAKPIFSFDPVSQNNYRGAWQDWPSHSFDTDPYAGVLEGFWTGHFWSTQGQSTLCALGLTQMKIEVDPEDNNLLKGYAVTYSGKLEVYGRRRWFKDSDEEFEEFDIVMSFEDGYSVRLIGKLIEADEEAVGGWATFFEKDDANLAYNSYPFGDAAPTEGGAESVEGSAGDGRREEGGSIGGEGEGEEQDATEWLQETDGVELGEEDNPKLAVDQNPDDAVSHIEAEADTQNEGIGDRPAPETETEGDEPNEEGAVASEGGDGEAPADEEEPTVRSFVLRRTPVEVAGFRHILYEDDNKAKARWNFLREAVLHLVRRRLWSWSQFKAWNADRRAFLDYYKRNWLVSTCNFMTPNALTLADKQAWYDLKYRLPPAHVRLCVETLIWSLYRLPFHYGISCDGCHLRLIEPRFICLTCMDPEMSNSFDLCSQCMDKPAERHDFIHTADHTLIKARQFIHKYFFAWLINEARLMTTRLKKTFAELLTREEEGDTHGVGEHHTPTGGHSELLCGCCAKPVRIPCWICITCARETYVCDDCEEKESPVLKEGPGCTIHRPDHHLLRLHNLELARFERERVDPTVARINALETTVNERFEALESTVESRIATLESKVEARLASFESLLRRIALQLNVPDHGEPNKDDKVIDNDDGQEKEAIRADG